MVDNVLIKEILNKDWKLGTGLKNFFKRLTKPNLSNVLVLSNKLQLFRLIVDSWASFL